jgi:hypothetical protein
VSLARSLEDSEIERSSETAGLRDATYAAYGLLVRDFGSVLRAIILPVTAAGLVLYWSIGFYLSELLFFLGSPDARVASLALGTLAAGLFVSLFFYAMAAVAVSDVVRQGRVVGLHFRAQRQEWRVYAAYLRLLLVVSAILGAVGVLAVPAASLPFLRQEVIPWSTGILVSVVLYWLFARVGFLVIPVVAGSEGTILRRAYEMSAHHLWRNCALISVLLLPGVALQIAGEYALRAATGKPFAGGNLPLADSARLMGDTLGGFLVVSSLSISISIVLLTAGAMSVYRVIPASKASAAGKGGIYAPTLGQPVLAEKLPK